MTGRPLLYTTHDLLGREELHHLPEGHQVFDVEIEVTTVTTKRVLVTARDAEGVLHAIERGDAFATVHAIDESSERFLKRETRLLTEPKPIDLEGNEE